MPTAKRSGPRSGRTALLRWYEPRREAYPWRGASDPYAIWISEVMLQQTQASRVVRTYETFLDRFPTVDALASSSRGEALRAWGSLGYNRRAVRLVEAARVVVRDYGGAILPDPSALESLPGIGPYTAAAVASIAFGVPVAAVDTNVRRVVARMHLGVDGPEAPVGEVRARADAWLDRSEPGTWNQAVMDLGREVCRPTPRCGVCPLADRCAFRAGGGRVRAARRRQDPFDGSRRQVRGRIVAALREGDPRTLAGLAAETRFGAERVLPALHALAADGIVRLGSAAAAGHPRGRVRLAR